MTCAGHGLSAAGWGNHDGELGPHKRPVAENLDLLNLTGAGKLGTLLARLSSGRPGKVGFPHDRLARHQKTTSSAINDKTASTSPALLAAIQLEMSCRISCSSLCIGIPL